MPDEDVDPTSAPAGSPARSRQPSPPITGVVIVGIAAALWWPAFTLGAWGTLFFGQLLTVWAASTAAFFVVLLQPRPFRRRVFKACVLLIPSLWLVLGFTIGTGTEDLPTFIVSLVALLVALVGIPFTLWTLVRLMWPDFGVDLSIARRATAIAVVILIVGISFILGVNQSRFLSCADFTISGNSEPPHCAK